MVQHEAYRDGEAVSTRNAVDVRRLLGRHVPQVRQTLRKVLVGRLEVTPIELDGRKGYRVEGKGSYGPLGARETAATTSGVPRGIRPVVAAALGFTIRGMALVVKGGS